MSVPNFYDFVFAVHHVDGQFTIGYLYAECEQAARRKLSAISPKSNIQYIVWADDPEDDIEALRGMLDGTRDNHYDTNTGCYSFRCDIEDLSVFEKYFNSNPYFCLLQENKKLKTWKENMIFMLG